MRLRLDALADLLMPLGTLFNRSDVTDALRIQSPLPGRFPPFIERVVEVSTLWPLYVSVFYLALTRNGEDPRFMTTVRDLVSRLLPTFDGDNDPTKEIVELSFLVTAEAFDAASRGVIPHQIAERSLLFFGTVHHGGPNAILAFHDVDPTGQIADTAHRMIGRIGRDFLATPDVPRGHDERLYAVAHAIVEKVEIFHRRRQAA